MATLQCFCFLSIDFSTNHPWHTFSLRCPSTTLQYSISQRKLSFYNLSLQHFPRLLPKLSLGFILSYTFPSQIRHQWSPPTFSGSQSEEQGSANFLLPTITSRLLFVHCLPRNFYLNSALSLYTTLFPSYIYSTHTCSLLIPLRACFC